MAKSTASKLIDKHVKYLRDWLSRNGDFVKSRGEVGIAECLRQGDFAAAIRLPLALNKLAFFYGVRGALAVLDRDDSGWTIIDRSIAYSYWRVIFAAAVTFKRLQRGELGDSLALYHELPVAASLVCYASVHGQPEWRNNLLAILTKAIATPGAVISDYWRDQGCYEAFILQCFNRNSIGVTEHDLPESVYHVELGPYRNVLDHWSDIDELAPALHEICDYHCQNLIQKNSRDPWPPFTDPPFDLAPCEILAIEAFRKQLGLESPTVDHALLATPLALSRSREIVPCSDETIQRVRELYDAIA